jgi:hypothetical protein
LKGSTNLGPNIRQRSFTVSSPPTSGEYDNLKTEITGGVDGDKKDHTKLEHLTKNRPEFPNRKPTKKVKQLYGDRGSGIRQDSTQETNLVTNPNKDSGNSAEDSAASFGILTKSDPVNLDQPSNNADSKLTTSQGDEKSPIEETEKRLTKFHENRFRISPSSFQNIPWNFLWFLLLFLSVLFLLFCFFVFQ